MIKILDHVLPVENLFPWNDFCCCRKAQSASLAPLVEFCKAAFCGLGSAMRSFSIFSAGILSLFLISANAEESPGPTTVEEIRAEYSSVVNEKHNSFELDFRLEEVEGKLKLNYAGGAIRTATAEYGHEHGWQSVSAYYKNGAPFFVLVEDGHWRFVGEEVTEDTIQETRYYVVGNQAIKILRKSFKGRTEADIKAARDKAVNKPLRLEEAEFPKVLRVVQQMVAVRDGDQAADVILGE